MHTTTPRDRGGDGGQTRELERREEWDSSWQRNIGWEKERQDSRETRRMVCIPVENDAARNRAKGTKENEETSRSLINTENLEPLPFLQRASEGQRVTSYN